MWFIRGCNIRFNWDNTTLPNLLLDISPQTRRTYQMICLHGLVAIRLRMVIYTESIDRLAKWAEYISR